MNFENRGQNEEVSVRMKLSNDLSIFLKKAYDMFGDSELLIGMYKLEIGKNLTPTNFWFFIDALYFELDTKKNMKDIEQKRKLKTNNLEEFDEYEDLQFILKMRKLISNERMGTLNLQDIKSTTTDDVISIMENYLQRLESKNNQKIEEIIEKQTQQCEIIKMHLNKFNVNLKESHPMFMYEQFEQEVCSRWMQEDAKLMNRQKCYICSLPHKLISCNRCSMKVHPACYPTFSYRYDNKNAKPSESQLKNFICQNCINSVDVQYQKCELCCCVGGHFVKANNPQSNLTIRLKKEGNEETNKLAQIQFKVLNEQQKRKKNYIHLSCFIWNTELKWNENNCMVQNLGSIVKKKINGMCSLCGISFGAAIPCSNESCRRFYHGQCAKRHGLQMGLIRAKTSVIQLFCERHRHLNRCQSLEETAINKFREMKKMLQVFDKEIKRLNVKLIAERDYCSVCGKEEGWQKIVICKQCRKWYHATCSSQCKNCATY